MRIDTGEELDIIHTTESLLVAVPTDGHTSEIVLPLENEAPCFPMLTQRSLDLFVIGIAALFNVTLGFVSGYIVVIYLLFPELQTIH